MEWDGMFHVIYEWRYSRHSAELLAWEEETGRGEREQNIYWEEEMGGWGG